MADSRSANFGKSIARQTKRLNDSWAEMGRLLKQIHTQQRELSQTLAHVPDKTREILELKALALPLLDMAWNTGFDDQVEAAATASSFMQHSNKIAKDGTLLNAVLAKIERLRASPGAYDADVLPLLDDCFFEAMKFHDKVHGKIQMQNTLDDHERERVWREVERAQRHKQPKDPAHLAFLQAPSARHDIGRDQEWKDMLFNKERDMED